MRHDEAILDYSPATRSYRYTIDGGLPVADNRDRRQRRPDHLGVSFTALDPGRAFLRREPRRAMAERTTV